MKLFHQTGFRQNWNIQSYEQDNIGDGLIFSPVNFEKEKLIKIKSEIKSKSIFDPQFYLINDRKGKLSSYNFFYTDVNTSDYEKTSRMIAKNCLDFQIENKFLYNVIPSRYYDELPMNFYDQYYENIISPFVKYHKAVSNEDNLLLTFIVKQIHITDESTRNRILNWITSIQGIKGVYLIFETNFNTKQIKDFEYLYNSLLFIHYLKLNNLEVHIGYTNTEGILYSLANPDSISMGSYENLRNFSIKRFETTEKKPMKAPRARLYIGNLFQWIDYDYIKAIVRLYPDHRNLIEQSRYNPIMFEPSFNWHFAKAEPYKHFFKVFSNQVSELPSDFFERISYLKNEFKNAIIKYNEISECNIAMDENSDGSHLSHWLNAISLFEKYIKDNPYEFQN
ncbi:MAG: hypothetical protein PF638_12255 [Candidatus Delongbacteria bacterium]|jgi:hypothetical protein|nr:hypothetical protein [Candidatus Delongbacteria bacterium]